MEISVLEFWIVCLPHFWSWNIHSKWFITVARTCILEWLLNGRFFIFFNLIRRIVMFVPTWLCGHWYFCWAKCYASVELTWSSISRIVSTPINWTNWSALNERNTKATIHFSVRLNRKLLTFFYCNAFASMKLNSLCLFVCLICLSSVAFSFMGNCLWCVIFAWLACL